MATIAADDGTSSARREGAYSGLPNKLVRAANGIDYAYRDTGPGGRAAACRWSCSSTSAGTSTAGIPR